MKISPHDFTKLPQDVIEFCEEVTKIINYGRVANPVLSAAPTWTAKEGESFIYVTGTNRYIYHYAGGAWSYQELINA